MIFSFCVQLATPLNAYTISAFDRRNPLSDADIEQGREENGRIGQSNGLAVKLSIDKSIISEFF
jgi:hypothetical protein